jgi:CHC2 zinc finger
MNATSDARELAALVPMSALLSMLGFDVNERTRRAPCLLHSGSNPTAFAWREEGRWHCFSCGRGGDRIALVRAVRQCSFCDAVEFIAVLAGVEYKPGTVSREALEVQKRIRESETAQADVLLHLELSAWRNEQDEVARLEAIRRNAGKRLDAIYRGEPERWRDEMEHAWGALAEVCRQMPRAAARYYVISFAPAKDRFVFALDAQAREQLTDEALERGWVADAKGYRFEVQL